MSLLILGGLLIWQSLGESLRLVKIRDVEIKVELADTAAKKSYGLSGRSHLEKNRGMLFVYDEPGFYSFWMKDMQFPIDIIWIDKHYRIVDIKKNVSPDSFPKSFKPQKKAQYVLEVSAGFSASNAIIVGDVVAGLHEE